MQDGAGAPEPLLSELRTIWCSSDHVVCLTLLQPLGVGAQMPVQFQLSP